MNEASKNIVSELAGKLSLENKTKEELSELVNRYPYFGFTQFLLAKKLNEEHAVNAPAQLQHAALYFSNPFWMDYLLRENESAIEAVESTEKMAEQPEEKIIDVTSLPGTSTDEKSEEKISNANPFATENVVLTQEPEEHKIVSNETQPDSTDIIVDETLQGSNDQITFESLGTEDDEAVDDADSERLSKLIEQHLSEFKKPIDTNQEMAFSARVYHAIDYFASQGIKLDPRLLSQDMLGNKVKKFTDWLKQMKRVNENPTDLGTDIETEHLIEKIAQSSNEAKDVITETMAEVLIKQGKKEKAIQLYQKLSFLNPPKSTYFATKINELKNL